jgi:UDP-N-acetylglucosamine 2-epimerase (non-hydrolysing)
MSARIALVLGIRPDIIRASRIIKILDEDPRCELRFIWSGQHYSDNLKDIFFRELNVRRPDRELGCAGNTDAETAGALIARLYEALAIENPGAAIFLGDTNTVAGCIAAAQQNIPIVHIEGCMRSYDWRMPEEKYRTMIDHLSDVIYAYLPAYRANGIAEGIAPERIVVTGNPIVEVIEEYYPKIRNACSTGVLRGYSLEPKSYVLMTAHRRENVEHEQPLRRVMALAGAVSHQVVFVASYRTQGNLKTMGVEVPPNVRVTDPLGYTEFLSLLGMSRFVLTDSGTVVEEACVLGVPSVQMRRSTERPEVYDVGASVRFDPGESGEPRFEEVLCAAERLVGKTWMQPFGDGKASERIADDILERAEKDLLGTHRLNPGLERVKRAMYGDGDL